MSKTVIETATVKLALEAGFWRENINTWMCSTEDIELFANLIRADEREACANLVFHSPPSDEYESPLMAVYNAITARASRAVGNRDYDRYEGDNT